MFEVVCTLFRSESLEEFADAGTDGFKANLPDVPYIRASFRLQPCLTIS
jgi:hypothetical protein